jgi:hypothetical protein
MFASPRYICLINNHYLSERYLHAMARTDFVFLELSDQIHELRALPERLSKVNRGARNPRDDQLHRV